MAPVNVITVARRFALVGFFLPILFISFLLLEVHFNVFHLPTISQAGAMDSYTEPRVRALLVALNFILCPPYFLISFDRVDLGESANLILWLISLMLNVALYFALGLAFGALWNRETQRKLRTES
jgi:hypothetical protein